MTNFLRLDAAVDAQEVADVRPQVIRLWKEALTVLGHQRDDAVLDRLLARLPALESTQSAVALGYMVRCCRGDVTLAGKVEALATPGTALKRDPYSSIVLDRLRGQQ